MIFNADDFGLTAGVNAGIVGAHRRGLVRSTSLMVTTPGFADAVALARAHDTLDLGVHLALTGVAPLLPPARIPSLVGRDGRFPPLRVWLARALGGRLRPDEVRAELAAQLARARATGLRFGHLNGHHHVHLFPPVAAIAADLAREHAIPVVRRVAGGRGPKGEGRRAKTDSALVEGARGGLKRGLLEWADRRAEPAFGGLARADAFRGFAFPAGLERWRRFIAALPAGLTEVMCHPGLVDPALPDLDGYVAEREVELRWLCDRRVAELLDRAGVTITSFAARATAIAGHEGADEDRA